MNINRLDRRIKIERQSTTVLDTGIQEDVWTELCTVFAGILPTGTAEGMRMRAVYSNLDATFEVRWRDTDNDGVCDFTPKDRVIYKGETYDIISVETVGRKQSIRLFTKKTN